MTGKVRPTLVFAYGNPSRGDDALGPRLVERLEARRRASGLDRVDLITDFQLQVEHALDLRGREAVVFVDAAASGPEPFAISPVVAEPDASYTTHAMSPGAILRVFAQVHSSRPPPAWLMAIRGYTFSLGSPLTPTAERNLEAAEQYLLEHFVTR